MEHRTLGDYTIIKLVGQGTLGKVYLAEHRFMKKQYLLKVLPEELASDRGFIQRFEEEVGVLASLEHANIVKIYNVSFSQGVYFLVTDCIVDRRGETSNLTQYLSGRESPLEEEELFFLLTQVASALDYAHTKKIGTQELAHYSLKPSNILIGNQKDSIEVHLSDFGLSRIIGVGNVLTRNLKNVADALNITNLVNGSVRYPNPSLDDQKLILLHHAFMQNYAFLAPEQKKIDSNFTVGLKADVYAFGVLTYFLLTQEFPEGLFELPSTKMRSLYNWDLLIKSCLQQYPENRPDALSSLLEEIRSQNKKVIFNFLGEVKSEVKEMPQIAAFGKSVEGPIISDVFKKPTPYPSEIAESVTLPLESVLETVTTVAPKEIEEVQQKKTPLLQSSHLQRPVTDLDPGAIFQTSSVVKAYNPEPKDVANVQPLMTEMAVIEGGSFYRGSKDGNRDEMPRHSVLLNSFAIDIHPVTNEQFVRFLEIMGGEKDSNHNDIIRLRDSRIKRSGGKLSIESGYAKHPVVGVTWYGAVAYAKWIGKRLPTEAEWEVAARGVYENSLYPTGDDIEKNQANFFSSDTIAVMSYIPNGYGLYDMVGNVYEWCQDWYGYNYYEISIQEPDNPQGPMQGVYRVLRGGCWKSLKEDLRCSRRHRNNPGTVNGTYGFRCAADVQSN